MAVSDAAASERGDGRARPETTPATNTLAALRDLRCSVPESAPVIDEAIETIQELRAEVVGLRYALTSRACIDEAKGILMAERGCDEQTAFETLTQLSQTTNVPLRDVAKAIVYKAENRD